MIGSIGWIGWPASCPRQEEVRGERERLEAGGWRREAKGKAEAKVEVEVRAERSKDRGPRLEVRGKKVLQCCSAAVERWCCGVAVLRLKDGAAVLLLEAEVEVKVKAERLEVGG